VAGAALGRPAGVLRSAPATTRSCPNSHLPSLSATGTTVRQDKSNLVHRSGGTSCSMADHIRTELVAGALTIASTTAGRPHVSFIIPIRAGNTCRWASGSNARSPGSPARWDRPACAGTTLSPRSSSQPSRKSWSTATRGRPPRADRRDLRVHRKRSTPPAAGTRPWATCRPSSSERALAARSSQTTADNIQINDQLPAWLVSAHPR